MGIENPEVLTNDKPSEPAPVDGSAQQAPTENVSESAELDDIVELLDRKTHDGPGDLDKLPPSNFESYATEGVEKGDTA